MPQVLGKRGVHHLGAVGIQAVKRHVGEQTEPPSFPAANAEPPPNGTGAERRGEVRSNVALGAAFGDLPGRRSGGGGEPGEANAMDGPQPRERAAASRRRGDAMRKTALLRSLHGSAAAP
jgi:hypothetical protein